MIEYISSIILLIICIIFFIIAVYNHQAIIDTSLFPEILIFNNQTNRSLLHNELLNIIGIHRWTDLDILQNTNSLNEIRGAYTPLKSVKGEMYNKLIKFFCLSIHNRNIRENINECPVTGSLSNAIPNVYNIYIMCFRPNVVIPGNIYNKSKYLIRCYIPYISTNGNCGVYFDGNVIKWDDVFKKNGFIILETESDHRIWNYTNSDKYILVIDMIK